MEIICGEGGEFFFLPPHPHSVSGERKKCDKLVTVSLPWVSLFLFCKLCKKYKIKCSIAVRGGRTRLIFKGAPRLIGCTWRPISAESGRNVSTSMQALKFVLQGRCGLPLINTKLGGGLVENNWDIFWELGRDFCVPSSDGKKEAGKTNYLLK